MASSGKNVINATQVGDIIQRYYNVPRTFAIDNGILTFLTTCKYQYLLHPNFKEEDIGSLILFASAEVTLTKEKFKESMKSKSFALWQEHVQVFKKEHSLETVIVGQSCACTYVDSIGEEIPAKIDISEGSSENIAGLLDPSLSPKKQKYAESSNVSSASSIVSDAGQDREDGSDEIEPRVVPSDTASNVYPKLTEMTEPTSPDISKVLRDSEQLLTDTQQENDKLSNHNTRLSKENQDLIDEIQRLVKQVNSQSDELAILRKDNQLKEEEITRLNQIRSGEDEDSVIQAESITSSRGKQYIQVSKKGRLTPYFSDNVRSNLPSETLSKLFENSENTQQTVNYLNSLLKLQHKFTLIEFKTMLIHTAPLITIEGLQNPHSVDRQHLLFQVGYHLGINDCVKEGFSGDDILSFKQLVLRLKSSLDEKNSHQSNLVQSGLASADATLTAAFKRLTEQVEQNTITCNNLHMYLTGKSSRKQGATSDRSTSRSPSLKDQSDHLSDVSNASEQDDNVSNHSSSDASDTCSYSAVKTASTFSKLSGRSLQIKDAEPKKNDKLTLLSRPKAGTSKDKSVKSKSCSPISRDGEGSLRPASKKSKGSSLLESLSYKF